MLATRAAIARPIKTYGLVNTAKMFIAITPNIDFASVPKVLAIVSKGPFRNLTKPSFFLHHGDLNDGLSIQNVIKKTNPDEIYNLAAQSHVAVSFEQPEYTASSDALGVLKILESVKMLGKEKKIKVYQASTSELYGKASEKKQDENTPFYPRSPYGVAKLYGHWITKNYRESYGMYNVSGLLFNHESERRGIEFVTRKISNGVAKIHLGLSDHITLGNLEAERDWGYAPDYVEAMWLMLQQEKPNDFVIATGEKYSIRNFLDRAFNYIGVSDWKKHIKQDPRFMRPAEVDVLRGDSSLAKKEMGWEPKTNFTSLVEIMVKNDIEILKRKSLKKQATL